ncbi:hypothetical protein, partial [Paenibacillus sp. GM1FR]|uniref:hypothetical protein n=1 Tax=Paenibacillus sp. GM1FR TaxID=2059267 RepID=UPI001A9C361F
MNIKDIIAGASKKTSEATQKVRSSTVNLYRNQKANLLVGKSPEAHIKSTERMKEALSDPSKMPRYSLEDLISKIHIGLDVGTELGLSGLNHYTKVFDASTGTTLKQSVKDTLGQIRSGLEYSSHATKLKQSQLEKYQKSWDNKTPEEKQVQLNKLRDKIQERENLESLYNKLHSEQIDKEQGLENYQETLNAAKDEENENKDLEHLAAQQQEIEISRNIETDQVGQNSISETELKEDSLDESLVSESLFGSGFEDLENMAAELQKQEEINVAEQQGPEVQQEELQLQELEAEQEEFQQQHKTEAEQEDAQQHEEPGAEEEDVQQQEQLSELEVEQEAEQVSEPEVEQESEQVSEPEVEEEAEQVSEPEVEQEAEQVSEPEVEQEAEQVSEPEVEQEPEQVSEPEVEQEAEQVSELEVEQEAEQVSELEVEQEAEQVSEPEVEPEQEQLSEPEVEQEPEQVSEPEVE